MMYCLGTGSGVGTSVLGLLEDYYPEVYRFTTAVYPSFDDDVITSPYNRYSIRSVKSTFSDYKFLV